MARGTDLQQVGGRSRTDGGKRKEEKRPSERSRREEEGTLRGSRTAALCFSCGGGGGGCGGLQLLTSWRIDCHYDYQLPHGGDAAVTGQRLEI